MDNTALVNLIVVGVWLIMCVKITYDQAKLYSLYKANIDPNFPQSITGIAPEGIDLLAYFKGRLRVIFAKHPKHPAVARLAKTTRHDFFIMLSFLLLAPLAFWLWG